VSTRLRGRAPALALAAVIALAAVNFLWQLGSSSYFVDEVISLGVSERPFGSLLHAITHLEITPPGYFVFEHEWVIRSGSQSEWVLRLPSALAAVCLVGAVCWLATRLDAPRWVALGAGALAAVSPLILQYAQLAQGYVFAALGATVALAAALEGARASNPRLARRWLLLSALAAAAALLTNYTAALVIVPLCAWVWQRAALQARWRRLYVGGLALLGAALAPLFIAQWRADPGRHGGGRAADLSLLNAQRLIEAPFDGRADALRLLGVGVMLLALGTLLVRWRSLDSSGRLIATIAVGQPLALMVLSAFGARVAITRYAVVVAPVMLVGLVLALSAMPRPLALLTASAAAVVSLSGLIESRLPSGLYADARGAIAYVAQHRHPGEPVLLPPAPGLTVPLNFYATAREPPVSVVGGGHTSLKALREWRRPVWVINAVASPVPSAAQLLALERHIVRPLGFVPVAVKALPGRTTLAVSLWEPLPSRAR